MEAENPAAVKIGASFEEGQVICIVNFSFRWECVYSPIVLS